MIFQKFIDAIRGKVRISFELAENTIGNIHINNKFDGCTLYYMKSNSINKNKEINTLILGSSHGVYGYLPDNDEFNLCFPSQDLYYSYRLYEKYSFYPNLKKFFVLFRFFSRF